MTTNLPSVTITALTSSRIFKKWNHIVYALFVCLFTQYSENPLFIPFHYCGVFHKIFLVFFSVIFNGHLGCFFYWLSQVITLTIIHVPICVGICIIISLGWVLSSKMIGSHGRYLVNTWRDLSISVWLYNFRFPKQCLEIDVFRYPVKYLVNMEWSKLSIWASLVGMPVWLETNDMLGPQLPAPFGETLEPWGSGTKLEKVHQYGRPLKVTARPLVPASLSASWPVVLWTLPQVPGTVAWGCPSGHLCSDGLDPSEAVILNRPLLP